MRQHIETWEKEGSDLAFSLYEVGDDFSLWLRVGASTFNLPLKDLLDLREMIDLVMERVVELIDER